MPLRLRSTFEVQIAGCKVRLGERTVVMGVVNVTPDSFSDGGLYLEPERAIARGIELNRQGATWIDVGGESSRPGSKPISAEEELARVLPVVRGLRKRLRGVPISIDTTKAAVAREAVAAGATIINDVSGLRFDPALADVARREGTPLVLMHLRGRPESMQQGPFARSVWRSVLTGLEFSVHRAVDRGVRRDQLLIDPGLGFGKTRRQNFELLVGLSRLQRLRLPVLAGSSRKSFVQAVAAGEGLRPTPRARRLQTPWKLLSARNRAAPEPPPVLLAADAGAVVAAILGGAHVVRVHDVDALLPAIRIADALLEAGGSRQ
jgi:dihydropteroate synthase